MRQVPQIDPAKNVLCKMSLASTRQKKTAFYLGKIFDTMNSNTKFFRQLNKLSFQIKKKIWVFQNIVIFSLFFLFLGFVFGNLFGTFLIFFRSLLNWDGLIISSTILIIEFINYLNYKKQFKQPFQIHPSNSKAAFVFFKSFSKPKFKTTLSNSIKSKKNFRFIKIINFCKTGLLLGFFIDAFKVGS